MGHEQGGFLSATLSSGTRRAAMLGIGTALAAALVGCSGASMPKQTPGPTTPIETTTPASGGTNAPRPTDSAPSEPIEVDVAAAEAAYDRYASASDSVVYLDSSTWEPLLTLLTPERREIEEAELKDLASRGFTRHGVATTVEIRLDSRESSSPDDIWLFVCLDLREIRYVDEEGVEWLPPNRAEFQATRVNLVRDEDSEQLLVSSVLPGTGEEACGE